jgi:hypothetical protein
VGCFSWWRGLRFPETESLARRPAVIEPLEVMPAGTIGLRASGKLSLDDYREGLEPGVWIEDVKTGLRVWVREHSA